MRILISLSSDRPSLDEASFKAFLTTLGIPDTVVQTLGAGGIRYRKGAYEKPCGTRPEAATLVRHIQVKLGKPDEEAIDRKKIVRDGKTINRNELAYVWNIPNKGLITITIFYDKARSSRFSVIPYNNVPVKAVPKAPATPTPVSKVAPKKQKTKRLLW